MNEAAEGFGRIHVGLSSQGFPFLGRYACPWPRFVLGDRPSGENMIASHHLSDSLRDQLQVTPRFAQHLEERVFSFQSD